MISQTEYFVDILPSASVKAPGEGYVDLQRMTIGREVETAIFQHPASTILFPPLQLGEDPILSFGCGVKESAWQRIENEVRFSVSIIAGEKRQKIFQTRMHPRTRSGDRAWQQHSLDLARFAGQSVQLIIETRVPWRHSNKFAWAGWANPRLTHSLPEQQRHVAGRSDDHPHIFLITTDALPARYLECYGHMQVKTPHLNQLAAAGVLFEQAWSQSCMTFSSYASILTGKHPHEHGVKKDWDSFSAGQPSLPLALREHGYHTLSAASSLELSERGSTFAHAFTETIPTLGNPMQDGAVTTRRFTRWLKEQRPDKPCFCWIHYFDTHPPGLPPRPFSSMYYTGDPTDQKRVYKPEQVAGIRGVESALVIRASWPLLEKGVPVFEVIEILEDTAAILTGKLNLKPDLAEHILNLGAQAMNGLSAPRFGEWLSEQTQQMADGQMPARLLDWLKDVLVMLETTEDDIISWLRGVDDLRFPLSMHMGTVSYFDAQVGALAACLREEGIYDQSLIVVTSPHGEVLDNPTLPYHHFMLAPDTLRVPLIMKLPSRLGCRSGARLGGVFDLIDLFPTLMDIEGLENSFNVSGVSRWQDIRAGTDIQPHDSFATGFHGVAHSVYRQPHLLVKERQGMGHPTLHTVLSGGEEVIYDALSLKTRSPEQAVERAMLRASLDAWRLLH
jgi:arylsulfatase A-like enzyme